MRQKDLVFEEVEGAQEIIDPDLRKVFEDWHAQLPPSELERIDFDQLVQEINLDWYGFGLALIEPGDIPEVDGGILYISATPSDTPVEKVILSVNDLIYFSQITLSPDEPPSVPDVINQIKENHPDNVEGNISWRFTDKGIVQPKYKNLLAEFQKENQEIVTPEQQLKMQIYKALDEKNQHVVEEYKRICYDEKPSRILAKKHQFILELMRSLGYHITNEGVCTGIGNMWMQAFLSGNEHNFLKRINLILEHQDNKDMFKTKMAQAHAKIMAGATLTTQDEEFLNIHAFLDGILLNQEPTNYPQIFGKVLPQSAVEEVTKKTASPALEKVSGVKEIFSDAGVFIKKELTKYFDDVLEKLQTVQEKYGQFAMTIHSFDHTIGLRFDKTKNVWLMIDANQLPAKEISPNRIAAHLQAAYKEFDFTGIVVKTFTTGDNVQIEQARNELRKIKNNISYEKANRKTIHDVSLIYYATKANRADYIDELAKVGADLNAKAHNGYTPAHMAAELNSTQVIEALARNHADLNTLSDNGLTPAHVAARMNNVAALEALANHSADLESPTNTEGLPATFQVIAKETGTGLTPLHVAAKHGHLDAVATLISKKVNLEIADVTGNTPVHYAVENGHATVVSLFAKQQVNFNVKNVHGDTPLSLALTQKRFDMALSMLMSMPNIFQIPPDDLKTISQNRKQLLKLFLENIDKLPPDQKRSSLEQIFRKENALGIIFNTSPTTAKSEFFEDKSIQTDEVQQIRATFKEALGSPRQPEFKPR